MDDDTSSTSAPPPVLYALGLFRLVRLLVTFLWSFSLAIISSLLAALLLLVGVNAVLGFGLFGIAFLITLAQTIVNLVLLFLGCVIVTIAVLRATLYALATVASRRHTPVINRLRLHWLRRRARAHVRQMRAHIRSQSPAERVATNVGTVLMGSIAMMTAYLLLRDPRAWNVTLSVRLPTRPPVELVGRSATTPQLVSCRA